MLAMFALAGLAIVGNQPAFAQTGNSCHLLTSTQEIPQGFGAAYNMFSAAKELLLNVECGSSSNATLTVGNGQNTMYVYRFGYEWVNGGWKQIALSGSQLAANDWYVGTAKANLFRSQAQLAEDNFVVAYTCLWQNNTWKCGCRDSSCSQNYWHLQAFRQAAPTGGGGGDTATGEELALCYPASGNIRNVSNPSQLSSALSNANPGDHIVVASGSYSGNFTVSRSGTAGKPVVIRAGSGARPVFTGTFTLSGDYGVLEGMEFRGGRIAIQGGDNNRVTRNYLHSGSARIHLNKSDHNRVDHNEIANQNGRAITLEVNKGDNNFGRNNRIDHNYLHDLPRQAGNGYEPIYSGSGWGIWMETRNLIDHNLLVRAQSEGEVIGIKTSSNRIVGTTTIDSGGYFSNRGGHDNVWKNNWIEGSDLRVYGKGTQIIGNHVVGGAIHLLKGDTTEDEAEALRRAGQDTGALTPVAENTLVVGNSGGAIYLGQKYNEKLPVRNTRLEANKSSVVKVAHTGTTESATTNMGVGTARKLTTSDVGLKAPDPSCP